MCNPSRRMRNSQFSNASPCSFIWLWWLKRGWNNVNANTPEQISGAAFPRYLIGEVVADSGALYMAGTLRQTLALPRVVNRFLVSATPEPHIFFNLQGMAEFQEREPDGAWILRKIRTGNLLLLSVQAGG